MIVEAANFNLFGFLDLAFGIKAFLLLFLVFYFFFALLIFRQIQQMAKKLPTALSPILKFIGIIHVGVVAAVLFVIIGIF